MNRRETGNIIIVAALGARGAALASGLTAREVTSCAECQATSPPPSRAAEAAERICAYQTR